MTKFKLIFDVELSDDGNDDAQGWTLQEMLHLIAQDARETWGPDNPDSCEAFMRYDGYQGPFLLDITGRAE